jgi:hypothetical protein
MSRNVIEEIELNIKEARKVVELGASLERLYSNRDFKKVILEGYFEQEAIRLVQLKADPAMQDEKSQQAIWKLMDAIGRLNQYFRMVIQQADMAKSAIESDEAEKESLLAEELEADAIGGLQ